MKLGAKKTKKIVILCVIFLLVLLIALSVSPSSPIHFIYKAISVPFAPVQSFFSSSGQFISDKWNYLMNSGELQKQYESALEENDKLKSEIHELNKYKEENEELRELLKLKQNFDNYEYIAANVIAYDSNNMFNLFTINKGSADGISLYDPVITSKGLAGKVISVSLNNSKVLAIIDETSIVMARVSKSQDLVKIRGTEELQDEFMCQLETVSPSVDLVAGDVIETAESGGIFPKGIIIGTIKEVKQAGSDINKYAIIEPAVDFKRIDNVIVLGKQKGDNP